MSEAKLLTPNETCERLHCSRTFLWKLTKAGKLPIIKLGKYVRYNESDITKFITEWRVQ